MNLPDPDIVQGVRRGDHDLFGALVYRYQVRLFNLVLMIVRERGAAEDVTQETFVGAFTHLEQYDIRRPFYPWLATIGVRLAHNRLRQSARALGHARVPHFEERDPVADGSAVAELLSGEQRRQVWAAVAALPAGERTVVVLHYREELSLAEIAHAIGVTSGTVKTLLFRARRHLRTRLTTTLSDGKEFS